MWDMELIILKGKNGQDLVIKVYNSYSPWKAEA